MNEKEDYFRISKNDRVHTLSDRIPINWKELFVCTTVTFLILIYWVGLLTGLIVATISMIGYTLYRFAAWVYYSEIQIDEETGKVTLIKKILSRISKVELITDNFDIKRFEYTELNRSGKNKFLLSYRTHKNHDLLILKNKGDKELIQKYIAEQIRI